MSAPGKAPAAFREYNPVSRKFDTGSAAWRTGSFPD